MGEPRLRVREFDFPPDIEAVAFNDPEPMGVFYQKGLSEPALKARLMEIGNYFRKPLSYKFAEKVLRREPDPDKIDPDTLRALKEELPYQARHWIEMVQMEAQFYGPEPLAIEDALGGEVPLQAVVAILEMLSERGDFAGEN